MEEPSTAMELLLLPSPIHRPQNAFLLDEYESISSLEDQMKSSEHRIMETSSEGVLDTDKVSLQSDIRLKNSPKFSVKNHLKAQYYTKRGK